MDRPVVIIVLAQLFGTSLWFSTNGVGTELVRIWGMQPSAVGYLTASVQAGFIAGTLAISFSGFADRFPASRIFSISAICGAVANACLLISPDFESALALRLATGVALAGIYPLGMKLIIGWAPERAGWALGWLVGMLTLGTALPHGRRQAAWPVERHSSWPVGRG